MDSPLNWAHLQERKAESFMNSYQFSEAIQCHQKAAEYLLQAMKMTQVTQALLSMQLQYENNLRQEKVLQDKWRRHELHQERLLLEKEKLKKECTETSSHKTMITTNTDHQKIPENMVTSTSSLVISAENFSVSSLSSSTELLPSKDEKDVMTDLQTQIRDLQMQVLSLTQSLEDSNRENAKLKKMTASLKLILKERLDMDFNESMVLSVEAQNFDGV